MMKRILELITADIISGGITDAMDGGHVSDEMDGGHVSTDGGTLLSITI